MSLSDLYTKYIASYLVAVHINVAMNDAGKYNVLYTVAVATEIYFRVQQKLNGCSYV